MDASSFYISLPLSFPSSKEEFQCNITTLPQQVVRPSLSAVTRCISYNKRGQPGLSLHLSIVNCDLSIVHSTPSRHEADARSRAQCNLSGSIDAFGRFYVILLNGGQERSVRLSGLQPMHHTACHGRKYTRLYELLYPACIAEVAILVCHHSLHDTA